MKKITFILFALVFTVCLYAQKPEITSIGIAGRAVKGFDDFNKTEMFTKIAEGEFIWIGYLYHNQTSPSGSTGSRGFKCKANSAGQGNEWLNTGFLSLRATSIDEEVSDGEEYTVDYSQQTGANDYKWRLKEGEDGYYKITFYTSDVDAVTMRLDKLPGSYADLISLSVTGAELSPAFSPDVTTYSCTLMNGTLSATPVAKAAPGMVVNGDGTVDVSSGSGVSTIVVTSIDENSTKTYTINYTVTTEGPVDYTHLIKNNNFDYVAEGVAFGDTDNYPTYGDGVTSSNQGGAWRPVKQGLTKIDDHLEFYGWNLSDWEYLFKDDNGDFINVDETSPNQSIGINSGVSSTNGTGAWINGHFKCVMPENFEFYQTIAAGSLPAGTYELSCLMGVQTSGLTSQRLFINDHVQFYGKESDYEQNKTEGEVYSYGGYATSDSGDTHNEMRVCITLAGNEELKIGIRSGNKNGAGVAGSGESGNLRGWFKMDYFRLIKLDASAMANANLANITLSSGTLQFSPSTTSYNVDLPAGTTTVTPTATPEQAGATITGAQAVDVSSGSGVSTIEVTALDGITKKTYTLNYTVLPPSSINDVNVKAIHFVSNGKLTVVGADAYVVYNINGVKIANVENNASEVAVDLQPGVYVVKTNTAQTFKVLVK